MSPIIFSINLRGKFQICTNSEVFHEIGHFLSKIWHGCKHCGNCIHCKNYKHVLEELKRVGFDQRSKHSFWLVSKEINQQGFELQKHCL